MSEKHMPISMPIFVGSLPVLARAGGKKVLMLEEKKPKTIAKAQVPLMSVTPAHAKFAKPVIVAEIKRVLSGPRYRSAKKAGMKRPGKPIAFVAKRISNETSVEACMRSSANEHTLVIRKSKSRRMEGDSHRDNRNTCPSCTETDQGSNNHTKGPKKT